jgi:uncharacterized membrane protein
MSRRARTSAIARKAPALGAAVVLLGLLTYPLLFTSSGFEGDWEHHLWLLWHQSLSLQSDHFPSLFLSSSYSIFYPTYAFYGGTVYAVGGLLSLALGGAPVQAYVLVYVLDFVAAFGGWWWLGRMAGVGSWPSMVPGLIFVTSAYYMLIIYAQGDWPAFTGISMIPLMVAAGLSVLRADRLRLGAAFALAASSILFFGAHNITILLGLTTLALAGVATVILVPEARRQVKPSGVARLASVLVPAVLVNAWYLLPNLAYGARTRIGDKVSEGPASLRGTVDLVSLSHLFTFARTGLPGPLPVLAVAWVLAGILILPWGRRDRTWTRVLLICSGVSLLVAIAMTHVGLLLALPRPYRLIQFSYRLEIYVVLALCAAILAALALARRGSRRARVWTWMAVPVCVASLVGAIQQLGAIPYPGQDRYETLESYGQVETGDNEDFDDASAPAISAANLPTLVFPPAAVHDDRVSGSVRLAPGTLVATNIAAGSYMVHITGARAVGIDPRTNLMVLQIGSGDGGTARRPGTALASTAPVAEETISVSTGESLPIVLGRVLTLIALAVLAGGLLFLAARRLRRFGSR